jgi:hypothetical protein
MRKFLLVAACVITLMITVPKAHALTNDWGGGEDDWSMPTGGGSTAPTVTDCSAFSWKKQYCRACRPQYWDNGEPTGYWVCAYVKQKAACQCDNRSRTCVNVGECYYY